MPLNAAAAAAAAQVMADDWETKTLANNPTLTPVWMGIYKPQVLANYTTLFTTLFSAIVANAVVSPLGVPPMSTSTGPVGGTGKIL
jgi:hypothetical protein